MATTSPHGPRSGPPPGPVRDLPIGETVRTVYSATFGEFGSLLRVAVAPLAISFLLVGLISAAGKGTAVSDLIGWLELLPYTLFGVAWHRVVLLGKSAGTSVIPTWQRRHWRFLGYALVITLFSWGLASFSVLMINALPGESVATEPEQIPLQLLLVAWISSFILFYLMTRLSFVFPAVAVDESYSLGDSWRHTRGQVWRMFLIIILIVIPLWIAFAFVLNLLPLPVAAPPPGQVQMAPISVTMLFLILKYLMVALSVTLVSTAFCTCTGWVPAASGLVAIPEEDRDRDIDESP